MSFEAHGKSKEELLALKLSLEGELASIRSQIQRAKIEARTTGKYASLDWWLKAHQALRRKGSQCQQVQVQLSRLKQARQKSVEGHFLDVVRERLGHDPNFQTFLETAKRRAL